jgi:hypothetical protein
LAVRYYISYQSLIAGWSSTYYYCLSHDRLPAQDRLDFFHLNPQPTNLHLIINPSKELYTAIRHVASHIAGPVQASPRFAGEGAWDELFSSHLRAIKVACRQAITAYVQFTLHAYWHGL